MCEIAETAPEQIGETMEDYPMSYTSGMIQKQEVLCRKAASTKTGFVHRNLVLSDELYEKKCYTVGDL